MKATATYQGRKIEARQGDDGLYRAYIKGLAKFEFEPMEGIEPSRYARKVVNWAVKALQEAEHERLKAMDWSKFVADSPDYYGEAELKAMYAKFDGLDPDRLTLPDVQFSRPEIERALLRLDRIKAALEE